jgi:DNA-binding HxlR family transcriptional regulator
MKRNVLDEYKKRLRNLKVPFSDVDYILVQQEHVHLILSRLQQGGAPFTELMASLEIGQEVLTKKLNTLRKHDYVAKEGNRHGHYRIKDYGSCLRDAFYKLTPAQRALKGKHITDRRLSAELPQRRRAQLVVLIKVAHEKLLEAVDARLTFAPKPAMRDVICIEILKFLHQYGTDLADRSIQIHAGELYLKHRKNLEESLTNSFKAQGLPLDEIPRILTPIDRLFFPILRFPGE